jgi:hypothetical protein
MERYENTLENNKIKLYLEACLNKKVEDVKIIYFVNMDRKDLSTRVIIHNLTPARDIL